MSLTYHLSHLSFLCLDKEDVALRVELLQVVIASKDDDAAPLVCDEDGEKLQPTTPVAHDKEPDNDNELARGKLTVVR